MRDEPAILKSSTGLAMALEGVGATGRVRGLLFELTVEQRYRNPHDANVEAVYTFPLPSDAVLLDLEIEIGGRKLAGLVVEKKEAERDYETAIDKGDTAIMLERAGDGLCTLNLGNLMAGEPATIRTRYAQLLRFEHGSVRLAIPTVIAPRYGDPRDAGLAAHQVPTHELGVAYRFALTLDLEGEIARGTLASPSHALSIVATATGMRVGLARGGFLDRDFVLTIGGFSGQSLATVARDGDRHVALASFCADVPRDTATLPLTLKLLVDCSGSMSGDSIDAARRALHRILTGLAGGDRFSLTRFGDNVVQVTSGLVPGSDDNVRRAALTIGKMGADLGGTEMAQALRAVFTLNGALSTGTAMTRVDAQDARRPVDVYDAETSAADVLLLTDGEVWNADELIADARKARQRVFVVGIGSAPAEGVLRRLADATGGACEFVAPNEDAGGAILRMFARLRAPRVERAEIAWPLPPAWTVPLPSGLFGGETIHAFAGFDAAPMGATVLKLHPKSGAAPLSSAAQLGASIVEDRTLARMAAARRIETASEAEQLRLALEYGLLTSRTNLLVVHERAEGEKAVDLPQLAQVAQMHAAGWHGVGSVREEGVVRCLSMPRHSRFSADPHALQMPDFGRGIDDEGRFANEAPQHSNALPQPSYGERAGTPFNKLGVSATIARFTAALASAGESSQPSTLADLARLGMDMELLAELRALCATGASEAIVVNAFLEAIAIWDESRYQPALSRQSRRALRHLFDTDRDSVSLRAAIQRLVTNATAATPA
ncbi:MAG: VIT domain-containing protein [Betaproteobacteria bacterium]